MSRIAAAFQRDLIDQPMMTNVVADMALEVEAATWLAFRFVAALDREKESESRAALSRIGAPIAKYWICKRAPAVVAEAVECHGGNGFIEDHLMARLYREAPLNGIWEGTGNVICLDVLRSMTREPDCIAALFDELGVSRRRRPDLRCAVAALQNELSDLRKHEGQARRMVERLALVLSASLLLRFAPENIAERLYRDASCRRLGGSIRRAFRRSRRRPDRPPRRTGKHCSVTLA